MCVYSIHFGNICGGKHTYTQRKSEFTHNTPCKVTYALAAGIQIESRRLENYHSKLFLSFYFLSHTFSVSYALSYFHIFHERTPAFIVFAMVLAFHTSAIFFSLESETH